MEDEKHKALDKYVFDYGMREVKIEVIPVKCIMGGPNLDEYELELTEKSVGEKILVFSDLKQEEEHITIERLFMKEDEILGVYLKNEDSYILDYKNCIAGLPKLKKFNIS